VLDKAKPLIDFIWMQERGHRPPETPEQWSAVQRRLMQRAGEIEHRETQLLYRDQLLSRYRRWLRETDRATWRQLGRGYAADRGRFGQFGRRDSGIDRRASALPERRDRAPGAARSGADAVADHVGGIR
jgi:hypothetical protein